MCWLPDRQLGRFAEHGLIELSVLRLLTLVPRPHREQGQIKTVLDVKLHKLEIDTESHCVTIGGPRTIYARYFNWPLGCNRRSVALPHTEVIDVGLAVHRVMEQASVAAHPVQHSPKFPRIYAGFVPGKHDDLENYDFEPTPALERAAVREIERWLCAGRPRYWRSFTPDRRDPSTYPDLRQKITRPCRSWADVCRALGDTGNEYLRPDTGTVDEVGGNVGQFSLGELTRGQRTQRFVTRMVQRALWNRLV
jgi:hypothetical protein